MLFQLNHGAQKRSIAVVSNDHWVAVERLIRICGRAENVKILNP